MAVTDSLTLADGVDRSLVTAGLQQLQRFRGELHRGLARRRSAGGRVQQVHGALVGGQPTAGAVLDRGGQRRSLALVAQIGQHHLVDFYRLNRAADFAWTGYLTRLVNRTTAEDILQTLAKYIAKISDAEHEDLRRRTLGAIGLGEITQSLELLPVLGDAVSALSG